MEHAGTRAAAPLVRLVVLNHNGGHLVLAAVESLLALDWPPDRLDPVVIDNASTDGSADEIERRFPTVRLIRSPNNTGFGANNLGLRELDGVDYAGLVNNDATVEPGWLAPLVETLEADPTVGAACPRILLAPKFTGATITAPTFVPGKDRRPLGVRVSGVRTDDRDVWAAARFGPGFYDAEPGTPFESVFRWTAGEAQLHVAIPEQGPSLSRLSLRLAAPTPTPVAVESDKEAVGALVHPTPRWVDVALPPEGYDVVNNAGSELSPYGFGIDRGYLQRDCGQFDEPCDVFAWCGAGVLLSRRYLEDVGLFDERFFLYYEDTDLSWRGRTRGWRHRYVPGAVQRHAHAATTVEGSPLFEYYVARNRLLMLAKNATLGMTVDAGARFVHHVLSDARRDVIAPLARGRRPHVARTRVRVSALAGFARMVPSVWRERRA